MSKFDIVKGKRILNHLLFWLAFFCISLYNELYLSVSFSIHPSLELFFQATAGLLLLYSIKILVVYCLLAVVIPRWVKASSKIYFYLAAISCVLIGAVLMRAMMHLAVWPLVYHNEPQQLSFTQNLARYFYSLSDLLLISGVAVAVKLFKLRMNSIENEKALIQEKLKAEMLHLKSQTNPHFLFNTLNSIYSLSRMNSVKTPDAIMKLSKILRYMLYETNRNTVSIREEVEILDSYIELQALRFSERLKMKFNKAIDNDLEQIAPLLILPLVENAFKHGNGIDTEILISVELKQKMLRINIQNGIETSSFQIKEHEGIGLSSIRRQLELLYKDFSFEYKEENATFNVDLKIDLNSHAEAELFDHRR